MAARCRPDLHTRALLTRSESPDSPTANQRFEATYFPGRTDVAERGCADLAAVVLFASQERAVEALPCLATADYQLQSYSETVSLPGFAPAILTDLMPPVTARYAVLIR